MSNYVNVGCTPETREKLRLIAEKTNAKKAQILDDALTFYWEKILLQTTKRNRGIVRKK